jgi:hypothetical protein
VVLAMACSSAPRQRASASSAAELVVSSSLASTTRIRTGTPPPVLAGKISVSVVSETVGSDRVAPPAPATGFATMRSVVRLLDPATS